MTGQLIQQARDDIEGMIARDELILPTTASGDQQPHGEDHGAHYRCNNGNFAFRHRFHH